MTETFNNFYLFDYITELIELSLRDNYDFTFVADIQEEDSKEQLWITVKSFIQ